MLKVCHMTSAHEQEDIRIFHKECASLAQAGYDVYLVSRGESYEKNGVHLVGVGEPADGRLYRMTTFAKKVYNAALEIDADIYHFHDPELLPYGLKLKEKGKKVIFDSHEMYTEQIRTKHYLPKSCRTIISSVYSLYEKYILKRIDGLIYTCLKDGKHPFAGLCSRTITIDNVPLLREIYDQYDENVVKEENSIVYVGGLTHDRGITHMVKAAGKAKCTAYLAGKFQPATYRAELESLDGYQYVEYLGLLDRSAVVDVLQRSQVGIATLLNVGQYNTDDNLATKTYEYMALGLPVVLTRAPYNEKTMERIRFGICVDPENVDEIADAIRYLLDHPEEAHQMGQNGRRAIKEEFNWDIEKEKLLSLYQDILKA